MTIKHRESAEAIEDGVEGRIHDMVERGREALEEHREQAGELVDEARRYVKKNPGRSVLIAAGVGFVLGMLLRRRD